MAKRTEEIFKVQQSLMPKGSVLVYNESRSIMVEFPTRKSFDQMFNRYGPKYYMRGVYNYAKNEVVGSVLGSDQQPDW